MSIHGLLHALSFGLQLSHGINSSMKLDSIYVFRHVVKPSFVLHIVSVGQAFEAELFFFFFFGAEASMARLTYIMIFQQHN